ncbi:hypothetical protein HDU76_002677 [Blyttiomyces sp. JEL0837]|nr:hypothetical protein HDU76_002677 [Blyttiomyces sp. JEL0837]
MSRWSREELQLLYLENKLTNATNQITAVKRNFERIESDFTKAQNDIKAIESSKAYVKLLNRDKDSLNVNAIKNQAHLDFQVFRARLASTNAKVGRISAHIALLKRLF